VAHIELDSLFSSVSYGEDGVSLPAAELVSIEYIKRHCVRSIKVIQSTLHRK